MASLRANKKPDHDMDLALYDDYEAILGAIIDETYLMEASGSSNLKKIEYISLQVDTSSQSLLEIPELLPSLKHLVLDSSSISSIRDLGVGLRCLVSISLCGCGMFDLDGIGVLTGLQELNLTDNHISDVTPLAMHENLQNLNLAGNKIADLSFGDVLASCPMLRALFLSRNPVERLGSYRAVVAYLMPGIEMLDGTPLDPALSGRVNHSVLMEASSSLRAMEEEREDEDRFESELFEQLMPAPSKASTVKSADVGQSLHSVQSSVSAVSASGEGLPDTGSELTHGSTIVLAGNAAMAIRKRRTGQGAPAPTREEAKEFESTLDVLDNALLGRSRSGSGIGGLQGLREGDITEVVTGLSSPHVKSKGHPHLSLPLDEAFSPDRRGKASHSFEMDAGSLLSVQSRPKSAFSGSTLRFSDRAGIASREGSKVGTPEKNHQSMEASPRQLNGSRPQSAANPSSSLLTSCFVPFVFGSPGSDVGEHEQDGFPAATRRPAGMKKVADEDALQHLPRGRSLVHLDIVKRAQVEVLEDVEDAVVDPDSDAEDIAITHRDRLRLMSSAANNSNASVLKTRQGVLSILRSGDAEKAAVLPTYRKPPTVPHGLLTGVPNAKSASSKAGSSLGFNLAGSLAAIDQWVQDNASEDDSDELPDIRRQRAEVPQRKPAKALFPTVPLAGAGSSDAQSDDESDGSDGTPRSSRILSRDAIFQMCADNRSSSRRSKVDVSLPSSAASSRPPSAEVAPTLQPAPAAAVPGTAAEDEERGTQRRARRAQTAAAAPLPEDAQKAAMLRKLSKKTAAQPGQVQHASIMSDAELVDLLRQPPKTIPMLRTKTGFQDFFRGLSADHFRKLVTVAYSNLAEEADRAAKIKSRMELMEGALN